VAPLDRIASRMSINNFSSFVGPAGRAGATPFFTRFICFSNMTIARATIIRSSPG